jgi:hypothetical protein
MSVDSSRFSISRTGWIIYLAVEVALFVTANLASKNASHPGTVSNIAFVAFIVGVVVAVMLGAATLIHRRRAAR